MPDSSFRRTLSWTHDKIHGGELFVTAHYVTIGAATYDWGIFTDSTKSAHMKFNIASSFNGIFEIFKAVTYDTTTSHGSTLPSFNHNLGSAKTAGLHITSNATGTTVVTATSRIFVAVMGSDGAAPIGGKAGAFDFDNEFVLEANSKYLARMISLTANNRTSIDAQWYEV